MPTPTNDLDDEYTCSDSASMWPVLLAAGSVTLGYLVGRVSYRHDLATALRRIEESSEPIEISIRTL